MNCLYDTKVILITSFEKELDTFDCISHNQKIFNESIQDIIKNTGIFPTVGDLIKPFNSLDDGNQSLSPREIFGREFDVNKRLIIYEIG